jgi:hypothetical protein
MHIFILVKLCTFQKIMEQLECHLFIKFVIMAEFSVNMNEKNISGALAGSLIVYIYFH